MIEKSQSLKNPFSVTLAIYTSFVGLAYRHSFTQKVMS